MGVLAGAVIGLAAMGGFAGCGVATATWVTMGLGLLTAVIPTIPSLITAVAGLVGTVLTAAQVAKLTTIFNGIGDLFSQIQADIQKFQSTNDTTLVATIRDLLTQLQGMLNVQQILTDVQITNPALVAKITTAVNQFLGLVSGILAILPAVTGGKLVEKPATSAQLATLEPKAWAAQFNAAMAATNGKDPAVDAAFSGVKAVAN
jgi:hypothetical protein